jgi:hypothetical protein
LRQFSARLLLAVCLLAWGGSTASAKVVVFWQEGFPTVASQPISRAALEQALAGEDPVFLNVEGLHDPSALANVDLLVLPSASR